MGMCHYMPHTVVACAATVVVLVVVVTELGLDTRSRLYSVQSASSLCAKGCFSTGIGIGTSQQRRETVIRHRRHHDVDGDQRPLAGRLESGVARLRLRASGRPLIAIQ